MNIIDDREAYRLDALLDITSKWGSSQFISGPVLVIPVEFLQTDEKGNKYTTSRILYLLPEILQIDCNLNPEIRYRGIYEILLYKSEMKIKGIFNIEILNDFELDNGIIRFDKAHLELGVSDLKGLTNNLTLDWNGNQIFARPGSKTYSAVSKGLHFLIPLQSKVKEYVFDMKLNLNGSEQIQFSPAGKDTQVKISAPWNHPSFCGDFLPQQKIIDDHHFEAQWNIFNLNRNFPNISYGSPIKIEDNFFGVRLFYPVDQYQQTSRSVKYVFLFLSLTFVCFFLIEILSKKLIHPIQYSLIGSGIVLFYLILLSLTEHMAFTTAYIIACSAMIFLIAFYTRAVLRNFKLALLVSSVLLVLYGFLFINLQLQDYALLVGSIGLFIALTVLMFFTRKIDWFSTLKQNINEKN
jgi:inner membrane protein